jgi:uncharacterized repeat protein (TIGR01451 family)
MRSIAPLAVRSALAALVCLLAVQASPAWGDAADPIVNQTAGTVTQNVDGTRTVSVTGKWQWTTRHSDCNFDKRAVGYAVDWNDPDQAGNSVTTLNNVPIDTGVLTGNLRNATDNAVHPTPASAAFPNPGFGGCGEYSAVDGFNSGTWGPIEHKYAAAFTGDITICALMYDVHLTTDGGAAKAGDAVAGGNGHNSDNSAEANNNTPLGNGCFTTTLFSPKPAIEVVKDGPATTFHGDSVTYTFLVSNKGNVTLHDVKVSDDRCAPVAGPTAYVAGDDDALLELGEQWRFTCTYTIGDHAAGEANPIVNTATAAGTDPAGTTVSDTDTHSTLVLHPAIQIVKSGPAGAEAGQPVAYTLTVTNPGDVAIDGQTLSVTDPLCDAPPQLAGKFRGDAADPTPSTLDPGDRWVYGCSAPTAAGQTQLVNTAQVAGAAVGGAPVHSVTDDDTVATPLTQPARIAVLPETIVSGAAKLSGPAACVSKKFTTKVTGRRIKSVTWFIDGKKVRTFTNKSGEASRTSFSVDPRRYGTGVHRLQARITFNAASRTAAKTLRMTFQRCGRQAVAPQFTG